MAWASLVFRWAVHASLTLAIVASCACAGQCPGSAGSTNGSGLTVQEDPGEPRGVLSLLQVHARLKQPAVEDPYDMPPSPPPPVTAVPRAASQQPPQSETPTTTGTRGGVHLALALWLLLMLLLLVCLIAVLLSILGHIRFRCPRVNWHALCCCCLGASGDGDGAWRDSPANDDEERPGCECSGEDIYGFALVSLVRESCHISRKEGALICRVSYIIIAISLLFAHIALQAFLLAEMWKFLDAGAVVIVREAYDKYELRMYGGIESNTYLNKNVEHRGRPRFFDPANFDTLSEDVKAQMCRIPFAEPTLYLAVIFMWSLSCTAEIKKAVDFFFALVVHTPTVPSMAQALAKKGATEKDCQRLLDGLTTAIKVVITYCILLPRLVISAVLLLIGCRCLAATLSCSELVLNAVVLEFVLHLSRLCYIPIASTQNKADFRLRFTGRENQHAGFAALVGPLLWGIAAMVWCVIYTFELQQVLPDFKWDVHGPCKRYFKEARLSSITSSLFKYDGLFR